jgi:hypothetical protein
VQSINDIYQKQVIDGVAIDDITSLNKEKGSMGPTVDIFFDHAVQEKALGKLTAAQKNKSRTKRECRGRTAVLGFLLASWSQQMDTPSVLIASRGIIVLGLKKRERQGRSK